MSWDKWNELVDASNRVDTTKKNSRRSSITKPTHIVIHITGTDNYESVKNRFLSESASAHYLIKTDGTIVQFVTDKDRAWHAGIPSHISDLYDQNNGCWKKYLKYFNWYTYPAGSKFLKSDLSTATTEGDKKLVTTQDGTDWNYFSYWTKHGTRNYPINFENNKDPNDYSIGIELLTTGGTSKGKYADGLYTGLITLLKDLCDKYDIPKDNNHIVGHEDVNPVERWGWDPNSGFEWDRVFNGLGSTVQNAPVDLGEGLKLTPALINSYYTHTEKETEGGYFPVGSNTLWHGGLHIFKDEGTHIFACMPGKVIAGRLADDNALATGPFGHRNFLLLEHTIKEKKCFSLYMHLKDNPLSESDEFVKKVKWLQGGGKKSYKITGETRNYRSSPDSASDTNKLGSLINGDVVEFVEDASPAPWKKVKLSDGKEVYLHCDPKYVEECTSAGVDKDLLESLKKGDVVKIDKEIQAGDLLWKMGKYGPKEDQKGLVHWEIFSEENLVAGGDESEPAIEDKKPEGVSTGYTAAKGIRVRGVTGPAKAKESQAITCIVTKIDYSDAPATELDKIKWDISIDGVAAACTTTGYKLEYTIPENCVGKTIKIRPYMNSPSDSYNVSISVIDSWTSIEDPDDDFNAENEKIVQHFGDLMADGTLTREELKKFFTDNPDGKAEKLRNFACKFASEWGVKDLTAAMSELKKKGFNAKEEDYKPYLWWKEAADAGVNLPSPNVWHYNPIRFLEVFGNPAVPSQPAPVAQPAEPPAAATVGIKKCEGPATVLPGQKIVCKVTEYTKTPTDADKKKVSWCVKQDGAVVKEEKNKGEQFEFTVPETSVGATLTLHPFMNSPSDSVCVKTAIGPYLLFNGSKLTMFDKDLKEVKSWNGVSGQPGFQKPENQGLKDKGPIPEGFWYVKQSELQHIADQSFADSMAGNVGRGTWPGGENRWGKHRVWISPVDGTDIKGRDGFCINGGKTSGSAGSIDLTGEMDGFAEAFEKGKMDLILVVKYIQINATVNESSMSTNELLNQNVVKRVLYIDGIENADTKKSLSEILAGSKIVKRSDCPKEVAISIQRALIYLSYPTGTVGTYSIDGDFGNGTNKGIAHFLREWAESELKDEASNNISDEKLIMQATYSTVKSVVPALPTIPVNNRVLEKLLRAIISATETKEVYLRDGEKAAQNLDSVQKNKILSVKDIITKYRDYIKEAAEYGKGKGFEIKPWWIAAFVKTETGGLPRPKFEHHWLYNFYSNKSKGGIVVDKKLTNIRECRFNSTSFGMGQLMGGNYTVTSLASSAKELFYMDESKQFKVIVDFLYTNKSTCSVVLNNNVNSASEVESCVKTYNGSAYKTNNYHNILFDNVKSAIQHW